MFRVGILASLRSLNRQGAAVGVALTASHNQEEDNGVKIIEPDGSMLDESWENFATLLAAGEEDKIDFFVEEIVFRTVLTWRNRPVVFVARDTRPSGIRLLKALKDGLSIFNTDWVFL